VRIYLDGLKAIVDTTMPLHKTVTGWFDKILDGVPGGNPDHPVLVAVFIVAILYIVAPYIGIISALALASTGQYQAALGVLVLCILLAVSFIRFCKMNRSR